MSDAVRDELVAALWVRVNDVFASRGHQLPHDDVTRVTRFLVEQAMPVLEQALNRSNRLAFQAGWNHATAGWERRAAAVANDLERHKDIDGAYAAERIRQEAEDDSDDWHDRVQHPVYPRPEAAS